MNFQVAQQLAASIVDLMQGLTILDFLCHAEVTILLALVYLNFKSCPAQAVL